MARPFQIVEVQQHTVVLDKEGEPNTVSIHGVTVAPGLRERCPKTAQKPSSPEDETNTMHQKQKEKMSVSASKVPM